MVRIAKLRAINGSLVIAIPKEIWIKMEIKKGDNMLVELISPTSVTVTKEESDGKTSTGGA